MQEYDEKNKSTDVRKSRLTILELMMVLSVLGLLSTWVLRQFFLSP